MRAKQRVITALVLLAILLPALFHPSITPLCPGGSGLHGGWRAGSGGGLNGLRQCAAWPWASAVCLACVLAVGGLVGWIARCRCGGRWAAGLGVMRRLVVARRCAPAGRAFRAAVRIVWGVLALWLAWLGRGAGAHLGINFLLSVLSLVWVADIFAVFCRPGFWPALHQEQAGPLHQSRQKLGRAFGRPGGGVGVWPWPGLWLTVQFRGSMPSFDTRLYSARAGGSWPSPLAVHGGHERGG